MDEGCNRAVREVFVKLTKRASSTAATASSTGARSARPRFPMPRWSMRSKPSVAHPLSRQADGGEGVVVATTRPETMRWRYRRGGQPR